MKKTKQIVVVVFLTLFTQGCTEFFANIKKSMSQDEREDRGVGNGNFAQKGFFEDGNGQLVRIPRIQTREPSRRPSSDSHYQAQEQQSWVQNEDVEREKNKSQGGIMSLFGGDEPEKEKAPPKNYGRATRDDFIDKSKNDGSLWASDGEANFYFSKNKVQTVGDIVSITVGEQLVRDARIEFLRKLNNEDKDYIQDEIQKRKKTGGAKDATAKADPGAAAAGADAAKGGVLGAQTAEITYKDLDDVFDFKKGENLMTEVVEKYPNGNLLVKGNKRIPFKNGYKNLNFMGIVRPKDLNEKEIVDSERLYEYRVQMAR